MQTVGVSGLLYTDFDTVITVTVTERDKDNLSVGRTTQSPISSLYHATIDELPPITRRFPSSPATSNDIWLKKNCADTDADHIAKAEAKHKKTVTRRAN